MGLQDSKPLPGTPVTRRLTPRHNDRLGAVYSAVYSFWSARASAHSQAGQAAALRRDAYSVILFDDAIDIPLVNDFQSSPDDLLTSVLAHESRGGTDYSVALRSVHSIMETHWSTDRFVILDCTGCGTHFLTPYLVQRSPVVIFLSDGECDVDDATVQDVCRRAVALGYVLVQVLKMICRH
jgi:hypothetical protein